MTRTCLTTVRLKIWRGQWKNMIIEFKLFMLFSVAGPTVWSPSDRRRLWPVLNTTSRHISLRRYSKSVLPSVCLSVRLSVTLRHCVKARERRGILFSPSGSPLSLVKNGWWGRPCPDEIWVQRGRPPAKDVSATFHMRSAVQSALQTFFWLTFIADFYLWRCNV